MPKGENIDININVNSLEQTEVLDWLKKIHKQGVLLMASAAEMKAALEEANSTTNEIAADIDELINKQGSGVLTPEEATEVQAKMVELSTRLKLVANVYTSGS